MRKRIIAVLMMALLLVGMLAMPVSAAGKNGLQDQKINGQWVYMKNGKVDNTYTGLAKNKNGWFYVDQGVVNFKYTGFVQNQYGWWYVQKGRVTFTYTGFAKSPVNNHWYYVKKSKVDLKTTDIIKGKVNGETAWWYVKNSKVTFIDTVAKNKNGWWKVSNGKVDFKYTGIADNKNGKWFLRNGKVSFKDNGVWRDDAPREESKEAFTPKNPSDTYKGAGMGGSSGGGYDCAVFVVKNSKVQKNFSGMLYLYAKTGTFFGGKKADDPPENYGGKWGLLIKNGMWAYREDGTWGGDSSVYDALNKDIENGKWAAKFKKQWPKGQNLFFTVNGYQQGYYYPGPPVGTVWQAKYEK